MKIENKPIPMTSTLLQRNNDSFSRWLKKSETAGDNYFSQHQNQLEKSALRFDDNIFDNNQVISENIIPRSCHKKPINEPLALKLVLKTATKMEKNEPTSFAESLATQIINLAIAHNDKGIKDANNPICSLETQSFPSSFSNAQEILMQKKYDFTAIQEFKNFHFFLENDLLEFAILLPNYSEEEIEIFIKRLIDFFQSNHLPIKQLIINGEKR